MLQNYLRVVWRNLTKHRQFTLLNLVGLSTGLACALMIYLWVRDERRMDKFNTGDDRLYQVMKNSPSDQGVYTSEQTPGLLAATLASDLPEVAYSAAAIPVSWSDKQGVLSQGDQHLPAYAQFASKDWFHIFSYPLLEGNADGVLADKNDIVLSKAMALRLFHTADDVVGRTVSWNQKDYDGVYKVSGVFDEPASSSMASFDVLFSYALFLEKNPKLESWGNSEPSTYILLKPGSGLSDNKIAGLIKEKKKDATSTLFLQRYSDRYLHGHYENGAPQGGRIAYVYLFSLIALFILFIACINFMNLATARAAGRMKEVGIKKVMGAGRTGLIGQFIGESCLMSLLAAVLALVMVSALLPAFNGITGKHLTLHPDARLWLSLLGITLGTGLLAGSYPAFYLSAFQPVAGLKGRWTAGAGETGVRKALVVFQFALSALFIVSVLIIYRQMQFIQTKNLGYNRDNIVYFDKGGWTTYTADDYKPGGRYETDMENLLSSLKKIPGVVSVANFRHNITNRNGGTSDISWAGKDPNAQIDFTDLDAGYGFAETLGMQVLEGRTYSKTYGSEKSKIVFNEAAIKAMGMKDPIGKTVHLWGEDRQIIGVVKDFHFQSLYESIKPCFIDLTLNQWASKIMVKIQAGREQETLRRLEAFYRAYNEGYPFEYRFLDEDYQALYASEQRVALLSRYFAGLAILISCLGLFGLAAFTAQRRRKEIGIRKVVGAGTRHILSLLFKDFLQPVLGAVLIAFPLAWWLMHRWLDAFAYRIHLGAGAFLLSGGTILAITLVTVSFQSVRAARASPVKSLTAD